MKRFIPINLLIFQLAWFSAALAGDLAIPLLLLLFGLHLLLTPCREADIRVLPLALLGWGVDLLLQQVGVVALSAALPLWLLLLWCHLVVSLNHALRWLNRLALPVIGIIGAIGGSSSYFAGVKLGAISTELNPLLFITSYAAVWLLLLPLLLWLASHMQQAPPRAIGAPDG